MSCWCLEGNEHSCTVEMFVFIAGDARVGRMAELFYVWTWVATWFFAWDQVRLERASSFVTFVGRLIVSSVPCVWYHVETELEM